MFIPYGTDAPIYHWPKATVGMIVANSAVFLLTIGMEPEGRMEYALSRGDGLHPVEWLTSFFMHADIEHLVGNMIFLWAFGIVVEGKLGAFVFSAVYLALGVSHSALMQMVSLGSEHGYILGASAAIYGLMAISLVWAPSNELNCLLLWRFIPSQVDIKILYFALLYIGLDFLMVVLTGGAMSTPFLHFTGALTGAAFGVAMLKAGLVDCEGWDIFRVLTRTTGNASAAKPVKWAPAPSPPKKRPRGRELQPNSVAPVEESTADRSRAATARMRKQLDAGEIAAAHESYDKSMRRIPDWKPTDEDWMELIKGLLAQKDHSSAIPVIEAYLRRADEPSPKVTLKLAQVLLAESRPLHALRVLETLRHVRLAVDLEEIREKLTVKAERMRDDGVLELDDGG